MDEEKKRAIFDALMDGNIEYVISVIENEPMTTEELWDLIDIVQDGDFEPEIKEQMLVVLAWKRPVDAQY